MTDSENIVIEYLRRIEHKLDALTENQADLRNRVMAFEAKMIQLHSDVHRVDTRLHHVESRLNGIERHLAAATPKA